MKNKNWFWGLFFIAAAILVIVNKLGLFVDTNTIYLTISILLIPIIIKSSLSLNFGGILFPFAIIGIMFAEPLGITSLTPWPILATSLLGTIGLSIIFRSNKKLVYTKNYENFSNVINENDSDTINFSVSFSSSVKYINTENFKKANLSASFGALKVYFDNAKILDGIAEINIENSFSGVELYIPKNWNIINKSNVSFSAIEEKNRNNLNENSPKVTITGNSSFSGIEIIYI